MTFNTLEKFIKTFNYTNLADDAADHAAGGAQTSVNDLKLIQFEYKLRKQSPSFASFVVPDDDLVFDLVFEFPNAPSGLYESLTVIINILIDF